MMKRLFSTSACFYRIDPANIAGPNMMRKMLRRQQMEIERHRQRQLQNQKPSLPKTKPNKLRFEDTNKSKTFSTLFLQNIQLVLHSPNYKHLFTNTGLKIIKARVTPDFSNVYVYWNSKNTTNLDDLEKLLDSKAADIRYDIEELQDQDMGKIPKIYFLRDTSQSTLSIPSKKEIEDMLAQQLENSEKIDSKRDSESDGDQEYMKQLEHMKTLKKRTDVLGFDRESVMKKVQMTMNSYRPINEKEC